MTISKIREALEYYANEEFQSDVIDVGSCGVASTYDSETACIKAKEALTLIDQMQGDMVERVAIAMYNAAIDAAGIGDVIYKAQAKAAIDTIMGDVRKDADAHSTPAPLVVLETPSPATTKPVSLEKCARAIDRRYFECERTKHSGEMIAKICLETAGVAYE